MSVKIEWDSDALAEFREAAHFDNSQQRGLGRRFRERVQEAIGRVRHDPTSFEQIESGVHRCPVKQFPYNVYYQVRLDDLLIVVFAIAHHKRRPGYWRYRTKPNNQQSG